ncbi:BRCT domain-containing protein [Syncephalis fuscata]|nr:BRCT domain-containing protein [Syncephalis fuscata]
MDPASSSHDPMLISEADELSVTTPTTVPTRRVLSSKTYGHQHQETIKQRTNRLTHSNKRPIFDGISQLLQSNGGVNTSRIPSNTRSSAVSIDNDDHNTETEEDQLFNTRFNLTRTTHCISWDHDFTEYEEVNARNIHVVTPTWVQRAIRNGYTHRPEYYSTDSERFLSGIVVATSQIPDIDRDAIFGGVEAFGGQWQEKMVKEVTHLIALSSGGPRYESAMQHPELGIKVVLPHWLDDCFRLRRRIPEVSSVSISNPPLLQEHPWIASTNMTTAVIDADTETSDQNESATLPMERQGIRNITDETEAILEKRIKQSGGQLCKIYTADQVDMVICRWRTSEAYQQAIADNKVVGTLNWLYHLLLTYRLESSCSQLLHYPVPKHGIPNMRHFIITISNYSGMAREYLKRLIILCGAQYTAEMTKRNTHVICAEPHGNKYVAATEWNIVIVNHLWLEESYRAWEAQTVTRPHYTHFPIGQGLLEIVGQTGYRSVDLEPWILKARSGRTVDEMDMATDPTTDQVTEIPPSDHEDNTSNSTTTTSTRINAYHRRQSALEANARLSDLVQSMNEFEREMRRAYRQRMQAKRQQPSSTVQQQQLKTKKDTTINQAFTTSNRNKRVKLASTRRVIIDDDDDDDDEKDHTINNNNENNENSNTNNKIAAQSTIPTLSEDMPLTSEIEEPLNSEIFDSTIESSKDQPTNVSKNTVKLLTTGVKLSSLDIQGLIDLGGKVVTDPRQCTHLMAKSAARTEKFLSALARACPIVTHAWLTNSIREKRFLDVNDYALQDTKAEEMHGFRLSESLKRAAKQPLFTNQTFVITTNVHPDAPTLARVVAIAGGNVKLLNGTDKVSMDNNDTYRYHLSNIDDRIILN